MTSIAFSARAAKLMKLCDAAGFDCLADLLAASMRERVIEAVELGASGREAVGGCRRRRFRGC
jgi:hypothetical protein